MKYQATAMRKNVDGKPDYKWIYKYSNNVPVLFDTESDALEKAISFVADFSGSMYDPKAEIFE